MGNTASLNKVGIMPQRYYKVVNVEKGAYVSAMVRNPGVRLTYAVDQVTHADPKMLKIGLGICAFDDLEEAQYFTKYCTGNMVVFLAEGILAEKQSVMRLRTDILRGVYNLDDMERFIAIHGREGWPLGTVLLSEIKLIRMVVA